MMAALAETYPQFLDDLAHNSQLRPSTLRAYRYELAAAAADTRFLKPLPEVALNELESWIGRSRPAASTRRRRAATLNRFFRWAIQQGLCKRNPLDGRAPTRTAIIEANYLPSDDTIIVPSGTYTLTIAGNKEDASATGDLDVTDDLSITGAGASTTFVDANRVDRVFDICPASGVTGTIPSIQVSLQGITVQRGNGGGATCGTYGCGLDMGRGILNSSCGHLTVESSVIRDNVALIGLNSDVDSYPDGIGAAIFNHTGNVLLTDTLVISNTAGDGGGINNSGSLTITNSTIMSNTGSNGGGIWSSGYISMTNSLVYANLADNNGEMYRIGNGGGIYLYSITSTLTTIGSEISQNEARGVVSNPFGAYLAAGGGFYNEGSLELRETKVTSNTADGEGGGAFVYQGWIYGYRSLFALNDPDGIGNRGYLSLQNSTVTSNTVTGIETWSTSTNTDPPIVVQSLTWLKYSTIAGNGSRGLDNNGYVVVPIEGSVLANHPGGNWVAATLGSYTPQLGSYGYNLEDDGTPPLNHSTDITNTNPLLGPLQDNGGPTLTMAPLPGSPIIDAIPAASCQVTRDQRGFPRPIGAGCEIGALEFAQLSSCNTPVIAIPDIDPAGISDTMTINNTDKIVDLDVFVQVSHPYVGDLRIVLEHEGTGTQIALIDRPGYPASSFGCNGDNIAARLDDEAAEAVEDQCAATPPAISGVFSPNEALSTFDGQFLQGNWTLTVADLASGDTGTLEEWCLVGDYQASSPTAIRISGISTTSGPASRMKTLLFLATLALISLSLKRVLGETAVRGVR